MIFDNLHVNTNTMSDQAGAEEVPAGAGLLETRQVAPSNGKQCS